MGAGRTAKGGWGAVSLILKIKVLNHMGIAVVFLLSALFPGYINAWFCNPAISGQQTHSQLKNQQHCHPVGGGVET